MKSTYLISPVLNHDHQDTHHDDGDEFMAYVGGSWAVLYGKENGDVNTYDDQRWYLYELA